MFDILTLFPFSGMVQRPAKEGFEHSVGYDSRRSKDSGRLTPPKRGEPGRPCFSRLNLAGIQEQSICDWTL